MEAGPEEGWGGTSSQRAGGSCTWSLVPTRAEEEHFQAKCANTPTTQSWANAMSPQHPAWWGQIKLLVDWWNFNACIAFLGSLENKSHAADVNAWLAAPRGHPQPQGMAHQWFELCWPVVPCGAVAGSAPQEHAALRHFRAVPYGLGKAIASGIWMPKL